MKIALLLFVVAVTLGATYAAPAEDKTEAEPFDFDEAFMCLAHGKVLNGRKTCMAACALGCMQPGCGGYRKCEQIPNPGEAPAKATADAPTPYLHKYRCLCQ